MPYLFHRNPHHTYQQARRGAGAYLYDAAGCEIRSAVLARITAGRPNNAFFRADS